MSIEIYRKNKDKNVYFRWSNEQTKSNNIVHDWSNSASVELVGSAGIEPASMNKPNPTTLFMTGAIPPQMLIGGLGRN